MAGKNEAHRRIAAEVKRPRRSGFDAFHERAGVTEDWWIQSTPMGDLVLRYLESDDLAAAMAHLARAQDETEVWFKKATLARCRPPSGQDRAQQCARHRWGTRRG
ncbi:hypothetical protein Lfu02_73490 [Longispora fulva]|uniref:hypothetical protein n=1 Tax=Longispora fulva TaxID=619741 RepID=UPI001A534981|nr:hypothetical protein Lfu02_73490 [Longispora fulva]